MAPKRAAQFALIFGGFLLACLLIPWIYPWDKMEAGTYTAFTESLLLDRDFNVAKRLPRHISWYVSPTFNYPDTTSTAVAILWAPFFLYGYAVDFISPGTQYAGYFATDLSQMIASVFFTFLLIVLVRGLLGHFFEKDLARFIPGRLFFGSGMVFFFLALPTNNDITGALLATFLVILLLHTRIKESDPKKWLVVGFLAGVMLALKTTGGYYIVIALAMAMSPLNGRRESWKSIGFLLGGFAWVAALYESNILLQRGTWIEPKALLLLPEFFTNILGTLLVGGRGYFVIAPIYVLSLVYLALAWKAKSKEDVTGHLGRVLVTLLWLKIVIVSFRFFMNEYFGPRILLTEFALFAFVFADAIRRFSGRYRNALLIWVAAASAWTALEAFYRMTVDSYFHEAPLTLAGTAWSRLGEIATQILNRCSLGQALNLLKFVPLMALLTWGVLKLSEVRDIFSKRFVRGIQTGGAVLAGVYAIATGLNWKNNAANVRKLEAQGFFNGLALVKGPYSFGYENVISELNLERDLALRAGDFNRAEMLLNFKKRYVKLAESEVIRDPTGRFARIADDATSYWDSSEPLEEDSFVKSQARFLSACLGPNAPVLQPFGRPLLKN